ncbi:MAG: hypothetical protein Q4P71_03150 [Actinomycetaceae bacterium]|nr:hypothetical protein [Actinomycetaceae bacterium]
MTNPREAGMVTAEFAVTIPAVIIVLSLAIGSIHYVSAHGDACHAARVFAREITAGVDSATAKASAHHAITSPLVISATDDGRFTIVTAQITSGFLHLPTPRCTLRTIREERYR